MFIQNIDMAYFFRYILYKDYILYRNVTGEREIKYESGIFLSAD